MSWWMLGISMVATTFAADTPNFVTNVVRKNGVSGNWNWWAFLLTGLLTTFVYAKLWKRSGVLTDLEFYELRYSGNPSSFLRGFRAIYLGVVFNCIVMAIVMLAAVKIGAVLLGATPFQTHCCRWFGHHNIHFAGRTSGRDLDGLFSICDGHVWGHRGRLVRLWIWKRLVASLN